MLLNFVRPRTVVRTDPVTESQVHEYQLASTSVDCCTLFSVTA